jgi:two-component system LytT family response regulator
MSQILLQHPFENTTPLALYLIKNMIMSNALSVHPHTTDAAEPQGSTQSAPMLREHRSERVSNKIVLPTMEGMCFEKVKQIAYLEASGNYTVLHFTDARQILVCRTLREVELLLPESAFARIHRSHTVHLKHLKKYVRGKGGHVVLQNGVSLTVSAGQKDFFLEALRHYFG